ncbi:hypothetical protein BpHYR1_016289 [Brachionus plicatilis]|uniref:RNA-directed DNA polymerase from mobile element jockey-like n=1 Tax=Brachionus plicatilis TaxID=10195 RepID=A0A3M7QR28_BRAPC|nr:hypothetical protein BpHYR1_016289 [Brachionus plicatilis]
MRADFGDFRKSDLFTINCGVKQAGVISPCLFNVFIDELILECLSKNIGAQFNNWKIKFNPKKSSIVEFGPQLFRKTFYLGKNPLDKS